MAELWDILDENGKITGRLHERGKPMNKGEYHLEVYVWIENDKGEYLISQRSPNKTHPLMWECTGGNAVAGDDSLTTALKEVKEELGITLDPQTGRLLHHHLRCPECGGFVDVWLFKQNIDIADVTLAPDETCDAMWADREKISRMIDDGVFMTYTNSNLIHGVPRQHALGVERYKVSLSPYDIIWESEYQKTKDELNAILNKNIVEIHHFGSTAINNIVAKPILDVAVVVESITPVIKEMESAGYEYRGEQGVTDRHLFVKRRDGNISTHHIHCYLSYNENLMSALAFCKFLNENAEYAKQYNDLKIELAEKFSDDRNAYSDGKQDFIAKIIDLAKNKYNTGNTSQ